MKKIILYGLIWVGFQSLSAQETEEVINTQQVVAQNIEVNKKASKVIILSEGFHAVEGSFFKAEIVEDITEEENNLAQLSSESDVLIYPNPSNGKFKMKLAESLTKNQPYQVMIYNLSGNSIETRTITTQEEIAVDISSQKMGIYIIKVIADNKSLIIKRIEIK
jgi:hypothetical protein